MFLEHRKESGYSLSLDCLHFCTAMVQQQIVAFLPDDRLLAFLSLGFASLPSREPFSSGTKIELLRLGGEWDDIVAVLRHGESYCRPNNRHIIRV